MYRTSIAKCNSLIFNKIPKYKGWHGLVTSKLFLSSFIHFYGIFEFEIKYQDRWMFLWLSLTWFYFEGTYHSFDETTDYSTIINNFTSQGSNLHNKYTTKNYDVEHRGGGLLPVNSFINFPMVSLSSLALEVFT